MASFEELAGRPRLPEEGYSSLATLAHLDEDAMAAELARTVAAERMRNAQRPSGGRREGRLTQMVEQYPGQVLHGLATLPKRAWDANIKYMQTGEYDPAPFLEAATLPMGGTAFGATRGALGAGPAARKLPMDEASRMARAKDMGFYTDMRLYHGSGRTFEEFKPVATSDNRMLAPGISTAFDPEVANVFAKLAHKRTGGEYPQVYPLLHRAENPVALRWKQTNDRSAVYATVRDAFDQGYDAVLVRDFPVSGKKHNILYVKDANQLRSPFAVFDPDKKNSGHLLAGAAGASVVGPAAFGDISSALPATGIDTGEW
jgi:hypothetical protein